MAVRLGWVQGGVYIESETLTLSRALPPSLSLMKPLLEKLPETSIIATLEATRKALAK